MTTQANRVQKSGQYRRDTICVTVEPGATLPQPGSVVMLDSPLTDLAYRVTVRSIAGIEWEYDSRRRDVVIGLRVWVRGTKEVVDR